MKIHSRYLQLLGIPPNFLGEMKIILHNDVMLYKEKKGLFQEIQCFAPFWIKLT